MGFLNLQIFLGPPQNKYEAGGLGRVQVEATPRGPTLEEPAVPPSRAVRNASRVTW